MILNRSQKIVWMRNIMLTNIKYYIHFFIIIAQRTVMLLHRLKHCVHISEPSALSIFSPSVQYFFARSHHTKGPSLDSEFEASQQKKAEDYFQNYRKQIQKDSIITQFRRQVFTESSSSNPKTGTSISKQALDEKLDREQRYIDKLLKSGSKQEIARNSSRLYECFKNRRNVFKGDDVNKGTVFRDYAQYGKYENDYVTVEDRNYLDGDRIDRQNTESKTYEFIESLPEHMEERRHAEQAKNYEYPHESLSLSEYGRVLQDKHQKVQRAQQIKGQFDEEQSFKMQLRNHDNLIHSQESVYKSMDQTMDADGRSNFQLGTMSSEAMNKIYELYLQGWSIREISRRFGILPARAKFYVWTRARFFNEALPKFGVSFLFYSMMKETRNESFYIMDYGIDLQEMTKSLSYKEITKWQNKRVDAQREAHQYTAALEKIEKHKKYSKYDMVQVGVNGKENKRHLLKEWRVYKGKGSDGYYMKNINKVYRLFTFENRKERDVYY